MDVGAAIPNGTPVDGMASVARILRTSALRSLRFDGANRLRRNADHAGVEDRDAGVAVPIPHGDGAVQISRAPLHRVGAGPWLTVFLSNVTSVALLQWVLVPAVFRSAGPLL
jgi:hypothetical protein